MDQLGWLPAGAGQEKEFQNGAVERTVFQIRRFTEIRNQGPCKSFGFCEQVYIKGLKGDQIAVPLQQGKLY